MIACYLCTTTQAIFLAATITPTVLGYATAVCCRRRTADPNATPDSSESGGDASSSENNAD